MAYNIYPVQKCENECNDYIVKINGEPVSLNTARVSAIPFNRRWPGHQRSEDQSELINFLSFEADEAVNFEIIPKEPFEDVVIRPLSLGIKPEIKDGIIKFTMEKPSYFTVEPYGRNRALHIFADKVCDYGINPDDENVIYFGKGVHYPENIVLKSNQTLFIDEGAVVYACIYAIDADNIRIVGRGILDNSLNKEKILFEANEENNIAAVKNAVRKHTVQLEYCTNIQIDGITIRDSLVYNIRPIACKNLDIKDVKIIGCWRYNSDGIDMHNCVNVTVENCFLRTFDDSICIKGFDCYYEGDVEKAVHEAMYRGGKSYDIFRNVYIKDCVIWNDWGKCLEVGAETRAEEISDIVFDNCSIIHVSSSVLDCSNVDYADIHNVTYKNITIEYEDTIPAPDLQTNDAHKYVNTNPDYTPFTIYVWVSYHHEYSAGGTRRGKNRDFVFENIRIFGNHKAKFYFHGYSDEYDVSNILIKDIYVNDKKIEESEAEITRGEFSKNIKFM